MMSRSADPELSHSRPKLSEQIRSDFHHYSQARRGSLPSRLWAVALKTGFWVVISYRLRNRWERRGFIRHKFSELLAFWSKLASGCYISAKADIGKNLDLPHPVGIVIGDGVAIGDRVKIYQGVTLGSSSLGEDSYPRLRDDVTIFANAVIIGGVEIGAGATIGAGAIVLRDVPAGATAVGNPARVLPREGAAREQGETREAELGNQGTPLAG
jgi:serine O-acetyltransferase